MTPGVWAEIDIAAIRENLAAIRAFVGHRTDVMAVVKADAYGHGLEIVSRAAWDSGARWFGVAVVSEGISLREILPHAGICLFAPFQPGDESAIVAHALIPMLSNLKQAERLSAEAVRQKTFAKVHLEIDTGMGRNGALPDDAPDVAVAISTLPGLKLTGLATHFPCADSDSPLTLNETQRLAEVVDTMAFRGIHPETVHAANSGAVLTTPESRFNLVRPGLLMYGIRPGRVGHSQNPILKPVLSLKTRIALLRDLPAGHAISYGGEHVLSRPSRIATLPVGYGDGYPRDLSGRGSVLISGRRAPILGRVCMDMTMVDVTDILTVEEGDEVVLMGSQGQEQISVEEIAVMIGTTEHDATTRLTQRVERIPVDANIHPGEY